MSRTGKTDYPFFPRANIIYSVQKDYLNYSVYELFPSFEMGIQNGIQWTLSFDSHFRMVSKQFVRYSRIKWEFGYIVGLIVFMRWFKWFFQRWWNEIVPHRIKLLISYRGTTTANGCVLIFVYMTYTMLPVRLREALFGGLLLSIVHVCLSCTCSLYVNWSEVNFNWIFHASHFLWNDDHKLWRTIKRRV